MLAKYVREVGFNRGVGSGMWLVIRVVCSTRVAFDGTRLHLAGPGPHKNDESPFLTRRWGLSYAATPCGT